MTTDEKIKQLESDIRYYEKEAEVCTLKAQSYRTMLEQLQAQQEPQVVGTPV